MNGLFSEWRRAGVHHHSAKPMTDFLRQKMKKKHGKKVETHVFMPSVFTIHRKIKQRLRKDIAQVSGETIGKADCFR